jgi:hypothetical protein
MERKKNRGGRRTPKSSRDYWVGPDGIPRRLAQLPLVKLPDGTVGVVYPQDPENFVDGFFPSTSLSLLRKISKARLEIALPLILAFHRKATMRKKGAILLTTSLWRDAGEPSPRKRKSILMALRKVPELLEIRHKRTWHGVYELAKGPLWAETVERHYPNQHDDFDE